MGRRKGPSLTRDEVVQAAVKIVQEDGAEALGVSRVARALGIKPPSIYNHVGPGDALARAVVLEANRQLLEALKTSVRGRVDAREQLRALARTTRQWAVDHGGLYTIMARVEPAPEKPRFAPVMRDMLDLFARPLARLGVASDAMIHALRTLRSAIHGFVLLESAGQFQLSEAPEASFEWLVESTIRGLISTDRESEP
jgi:AcrR family transcriptional regulator